MPRAIIYHQNLQTKLFEFLINKDALPVICRDFIENKDFLKRQLEFDWNVGNYGKDCMLLELVSTDAQALLQKEFCKSQYLVFFEAVKKLVSGTDRRYLQLAVQFLSQGGLDDAVMATMIDRDLLNLLRTMEE